MVRRKWTGWALATMICALAVYAFSRWDRWREAGQAASAYAARITCSCRYVEARSLKSCKGDIKDEAWMVSLRDDPQAKAVSGSIPLLGDARAHFRPGFGCLLEPASRQKRR